jgi:hypothetical protein
MFDAVDRNMARVASCSYFPTGKAALPQWSREAHAPPASPPIWGQPRLAQLGRGRERCGAPLVDEDPEAADVHGARVWTRDCRVFEVAARRRESEESELASRTPPSSRAIALATSLEHVRSALVLHSWLRIVQRVILVSRSTACPSFATARPPDVTIKVAGGPSSTEQSIIELSIMMTVPPV